MKRFQISKRVLCASATLFITAAVCLATPALARPGGQGCRGGDRLEHQIGELDLDDETRTAVYAVLDKARAENRTHERDLHGAREQMRALLAADTPVEDTVLAQAERIGELETQRHRDRLKTMLAVRELIGSDAWAEFHKRQERPEQRGPLRSGQRGRR
ncbi:MAG: periplasmic heavy metal sensor [bacterium]|nr:periplasmic heavy metal sensor [bacterium]